jgi:transposase
MPISHPFDLVIGLDRSDRKADLYSITTASGDTHPQTIATSPEALHDWLRQLRQQHPQARVALCLEQPAASLILFLETYAWITLYAINPVTLQKFREAFVTSRAKDDAKDARYLAELLFTHHDKLQPWQPDDAQTRLLQQLVSHRRAVIDERTGLTNRLQALLKQYFPQALDLCGEELWRPLATAFLLKWPTLQALQKSQPATVKKFYYLHGSRSQQLIEQRLEQIAAAIALTEEAAVLESHVLRVQLLCRQLQALQRTLAQFEQRLAEVFRSHPDRELFESLPGAGPVLAPRLLASLGSERERYEDAASLSSFSGIAPVTRQSGGKHHVHRRYRCPLFMKQSFHEYARESVRHSRWAAAHYRQQREKGSGHHAAVRSLAFKWQRVIWKCWQSRTAYREEVYEAALRKSGSPLVALLDQIQLGKSPFKSTPDKLKKPLAGSPQR